VPHLVISEVEGNFKKFNGTFTTTKSDFSDAKINFNVDINSIDTDNENRDKHLKSDDFFNAAEYPEMIFKSSSIKKLSGNKYALYGNLTIRNVTKPVKFDVVYGGTAKDGYGNTKAGFRATTKINRFDYNLKWNNLTEAGGATVGKDVTIDMKLEFAQAKS
jgi:polyisoprenoid-binding protein YceI